MCDFVDINLIIFNYKRSVIKEFFEQQDHSIKYYLIYYLQPYLKYNLVFIMQEYFGLKNLHLIILFHY